jgi:hypothetical protein
MMPGSKYWRAPSLEAGQAQRLGRQGITQMQKGTQGLKKRGKTTGNPWVFTIK